MKRFPILMLALLIVGCGDKVWVKGGATQKDFARDKSLCVEKSQLKRDASATTPSEKTADPEKFSTCMETLGYALEYQRKLNPRRFWRRN